MQIEVNHQSLRSLASAIDEYAGELKAAVSSANNSVQNMLSSGWKGDDATAFGQQWQAGISGSSDIRRFQASMENYSDALNACAAIYSKAQEDAYNRAAMLPRY